jgi:hypothetical protein
LGDGAADHDIRNSAVSTLAEIDISIAEDWLDKLDDPQLTNNLMQNIASVKSQTDPESAYQWLQGLRGLSKCAVQHRTTVGNKRPRPGGKNT